MLESTLDELPDLEKGFAEVMKAWQDGDQATLINLLKEEMAPPKLQASLEQTLLAERNRNWVKRVARPAKRGFIVVGALHLYGEHGPARAAGAARLAHHAAHRTRSGKLDPPDRRPVTGRVPGARPLTEFVAD